MVGEEFLLLVLSELPHLLPLCEQVVMLVDQGVVLIYIFVTLLDEVFQLGFSVLEFLGVALKFMLDFLDFGVQLVTVAFELLVFDGEEPQTAFSLFFALAILN